MTPQRRAAVERGAPLTDAEKAAGWHFCNEWDGMCLHPDSPEAQVCGCPLRAKHESGAKSLVGLGQGDSLVARLGNVDQSVSGSASGAQEEATVPIHLGRDGLEHDSKAAAPAGPHGSDATPADGSGVSRHMMVKRNEDRYC
jgi:hypothetical protein